METQDWQVVLPPPTSPTSLVPKSLYQITLWSKIWGELQKKFFFRERAGCGQEGGETGPLAFIPREMASTRDTSVLKFLTFP